jgi:hypothetical protein
MGVKLRLDLAWRTLYNAPKGMNTIYVSSLLLKKHCDATQNSRTMLTHRLECWLLLSRNSVTVCKVKGRKKPNTNTKVAEEFASKNRVYHFQRNPTIITYYGTKK